MIKNEKGNVMFTTLIMLVFVIFASFLMFQVFGIFVVRRQAQNLADSAAMAAINELRNQYENEMQKNAEEAIDDFWDEVEAYQDSFDEDPPSDVEVVKGWIEDSELEEQLLGHESLEWIRVVKEEWFNDNGYFGSQINGTVLYDVCKNNNDTIKSSAKTLIEKNNGNADDFTIEFPGEGKPKLLLVAKKTVRIGANSIIKFQFEDNISAISATGITAPFDIDVSSKVPFKL